MNAKQELISHLLRIDKKMICATISKSIWNFDEKEEESSVNEFNLKMIYSAEDYDKFLSDLDFEYDNGYGLQELYGTVWFSDGVWMERGEYDGSEWWEIHTYPKIPVELES
jgi:hypothetical protein